MSLKQCSIKGCERRDIVALQRQIQEISLPPSSDPNQPSYTNSIKFNYFCQVHFDRNELRKKNVRLLPATSLSTVDGSNSVVGKAGTNHSLKELLLNHGLHPNRKRASDRESHASQAKLIKFGKSWPPKSKDSTNVNVSVNKFQKVDFKHYGNSEYDQSEPETTTVAEDNEDCIITEDPLPTVIDLSDDDDDANESNKMIELILCDETEPDCAETTKEYLVEISNECEDQDDVEPLNMDFVSFKDQSNGSIDLIDMENEDMAEGEDDETKQSSDSRTAAEKSCENVGPVANKSIDLTNEQTVDEEETNVDIEGFRSAVIREIRRRLSKKFPGVIQTVSWNVKSQQFEVNISKRSGFKVDDGFQQFLREVVNQAIQGNDRASKSKAARCSRRKGNGQQVNKNVILNKEYTGKNQQEVLKRPTANSPLTRGTQSTQSKCNITPMLRKSESYLGIRATTFRHIKNILPDRLRNHVSCIAVILRKIKLNESFSILSDGLCVAKKDCTENFNEFLPILSHTLRGFLQWPTKRREPLAIVDILEIEIEKPRSTVKQNIMFCSRRQRYLTKFIICVTSTGYITYISPPFQAVRTNILTSCLLTIPHCSSVLAHPDLFESVTLNQSSRISSLYEYDRKAERKIIQRVFDCLRRFGLISGTSHLKNEMLLHHALAVVACLCNFELEQ